jgi:opacity protein-like surface antigen
VRKTLIAGCLAMASMSAMADENSGLFLSAGFGQSTYDVEKADLDDLALAAFEEAGASVLDADSSFDDKGDAWSLSVGYRFSQYFTVEAGYVDLGSTEYRAAGPVFIPGLGTMDASVGVDISATGPMIAAGVFAPLGERFDLHGHLGMLFTDVEFEISAGVEDFSESDSFSASSEDVFAGVGAAFHVTKNFALSLDYSLFQDVGDEEETGEGDVTSLRLSAQYKF